ncbi:GntR family transcriptional regulator [Bradyrhizobium yuanmingense]|uniref:GntR family transcriptional regulator n=1 Tax=Bradyrhizobium yuanmingense TaxID=108015 RepID=UPI0023B8FEB4|nr:GntR family transcriptional regulator [Bradyrhizobium yuanmingense]MDF0498202.1 GntR family transcriptional regulator [Bradyrhizobium yuanmingense]MDF0520156.1 GntR family transcriptional regulator [Bradyrhizobium yuanmingense]MDF0584206.1 GntR family transcriptional regulator [Bradyrhizobium yuanmingense]
MVKGVDKVGLGGSIRAVERETLNDRVYRELRTMIMSGGFAPGSEMKLRDLAQSLHVSPMPVRDAIGRLVVERALKMLPNHRVIVPETTIDEFLEIRRVRILLEGEAAALACQHVSPDVIASLKRIHEKIKSLSGNKQRQFWALNQEFHFTVYEAAKSPLILSMIESLWLQIGPVFNHIPINLTSEGARGHQRIIAALGAGDAKAARAALTEDLMKGGDRIIAALIQDKQPAH